MTRPLRPRPKGPALIRRAALGAALAASAVGCDDGEDLIDAADAAPSDAEAPDGQIPDMEIIAPMPPPQPDMGLNGEPDADLPDMDILPPMPPPDPDMDILPPMPDPGDAEVPDAEVPDAEIPDMDILPPMPPPDPDMDVLPPMPPPPMPPPPDEF